MSCIRWVPNTFLLSIRNVVWIQENKVFKLGCKLMSFENNDLNYLISSSLFMAPEKYQQLLKIKKTNINSPAEEIWTAHRETVHWTHRRSPKNMIFKLKAQLSVPKRSISHFRAVLTCKCLGSEMWKSCLPECHAGWWCWSLHKRLWCAL